jgi:hypothetical protein
MCVADYETAFCNGKMRSGIFDVTVSIALGILCFDVLTLHFQWLSKLLFGLYPPEKKVK